MNNLTKFIAIGLTVVFLLTSCATQRSVQKSVTTQKSTESYKLVETKLQQPSLSESKADLKVVVENNHKDFNLDKVQCIYAEKYIKMQTCTSKKLQGNESVTVKCIAADDLTYAAVERGTCAKLICANVDRADCHQEGNSAINLRY